MTPSELRQQGREAYPHYCNPYKRSENTCAYENWEEGFAQAKHAAECEIRKCLMSDNEMIERGAKAIFETLCPGIHYDNADKPYYELASIAVIKAMREPTEKMLSAADGDWCDDDRPELKREYQAMIDAVTND